ncbi:hemolymph lipopolysaccharide-binding protein-like isoform X2 [Bacillus rossius redtenbacheri]
MTKMAQNLMSQTAVNYTAVGSEGTIEMQFSGFTSTIKFTGANKPTLENTTSNAKNCCVAGDAVCDAAARLQQLGYEEGLGGHYYKTHGEARNWWAARRTCEKEGGHLVVVNSNEEALLVTRMISAGSVLHTDYSDQAYVGASDLEEEGVFVTVLGGNISTSGYGVWFASNPSNNKNVNPFGEHCVSLFIDGTHRGLNDVHCEAKLPFVCETSVPEIINPC